MMKLKCFLIFSVFVSIEAASLAREIIPVNVVYLEHSENLGIPRERSHVRYLQNRNLDEKVQLSEEDLKVVTKHVPLAYKSTSVDEQNELFLEKTKNVFLEALSNIRKRIDSLPFVRNGKKPSAEQWTNLNEKIEDLFRKYKNDIKEENQSTNFFTEMVQTATNWFQGVSNNRPTGEEDEQTQESSGIGQIWNDFQQSVSTFFNNVSNNNQVSSTTSTVLGDTGTSSSTQSPDIFGFFNNIFNNQGGDTSGSSSSSPNIFQTAFFNFINGLSPSSQAPVSSTAGNEPSSTQGTIEKFSDSVDQFFAPSAKPPSASGDTGNKPEPSFLDNVGSAIQNFFNPSTTPSSVVQSEGSSATSNNPIVSTFQEGLQQIGNGFQLPGAQNSGSSQSGNVPGIQQIQNVGQQIAGNVQIPGNLGVEQFQGAGQQLTGNVPSNLNIDQIQTAGQQIGENLQVPSNLNIDQIQTAGQQLGANLQNPVGQLGAENSQLPGNLNINQIQAAGQQLGANLQNPVGQLGAENSQLPGNLNINQIQAGGQQLSENPQLPNLGQLQNAGQQFLGGQSQGGSSTQIINQIQSTSNQIQNAASNINNADTQIQQIVGSNQVNQLSQIGAGSIPSANPSSSSRPPVSLINQINNVGEQFQLQLNPSNQASDNKKIKSNNTE